VNAPAGESEGNIETFHFLRWGFDITALRGLLERTRTPAVKISISVDAAARFLESDPTMLPPGKRVFPLVGVDVQWKHVDALAPEALDAPLFVAPMGELGQMVIDGWHRIALARRLGVSTLPGLLITRRQASRVLLPRSARLPPEKKDFHD
jgi:hypothetical protein